MTAAAASACVCTSTLLRPSSFQRPARRVDGVLRFMNSSGEFYLDDASIEELRIENVAPLYLEQVRQLADGLVRDLLQERPIYTLGQMGEEKRIMGSDIKSVTVHDGKLLIELALP
jgi:hypothetical protein